MISYVAVDNGGKADLTAGSVSLPLTTVSLAGLVWNDVDGGVTQNGSEGVINGTNAGVNVLTGAVLYANLVDPNGIVIATTTISANGTYSFVNVPTNTSNLTVQLSTIQGTTGVAKAAAVLPSATQVWAATGESNNGVSDGTGNAEIAVTTAAGNVTLINFGIEQRPESALNLQASQANPGGFNFITVPSGAFFTNNNGGVANTSDFNGGTITSITVTAFPANANAFRVGAVTYTNGGTCPPATTCTAWPGTLSIPYTNGTGTTPVIQMDPVDGTASPIIFYAAVDNAGNPDLTPGSVTFPLTAISIGGLVWNDVDGNNNQNGGETVINGTNAGANVLTGAVLYANLADASNNIIATTTVNANGTYFFGTVPPNTTVTVQLSTSQGTLGAAKGTSVLPATTAANTWIATGENNNNIPDGTGDAEIAVNIGTTSATLVNFGIERIPVVADYTATSQNNPGSSNIVLVPAPAFTGTDAEDGGYPTGLAGRKMRLHPATNGTLYYNGAAVLAATDFPGFDPALVTVDPVDGASITSSFNYQVYDNANFPSLSKSINIPFLQTSITLSLKVLLQGATFGNGAGFESIMRDNLRSSTYPDVSGMRYIPNIDPYSNNVEYSGLFTKVGDGTNPALQTVADPATMFNSRSTSSAVDWIFIELRDKSNPANVVATRSAIVQRDGTVIDIDGSSCIRFPSLLIDDYYVAVRHRNHLGAMTATAIPAVVFNCSSSVDFTTMTDAQLWNNAGYDGLEQAILDDGKRALWSGNANGDNKVKYQGGTNDRTLIQSDVVNFPNNTTLNVNYDQAFGYFSGDINLDSKAKYQGSANDRTILQSLVLGYLLNTTLNINYDLFLQQLP